MQSVWTAPIEVPESVEHREEELAEIDLTEDEIDVMMAAGEPVDIAGPAGRAQTVRFELFSDARRRYGWRLVSSTGEILATGGRFSGPRTKRSAPSMRACARLLTLL